MSIITVLNLRGLGETARAFLVPTMVFIVGLLAIIVVGLIHPLGRTAAPIGRVAVPTRGLEAVGIVLVLKAFANGCSALTGVEAIANGVPLFRQPRRLRAKRTEVLLGVILGTMLLGLAVLAVRFHVEPRTGQTVLSQIMALSVGRHWAYYVVSLAITVVLGLAANTSFGGLPILASLLARDNYLPHLFSVRGDRQMLDNGIMALSVFSAALLAAVNGDTQRLIPLFAIGVFTGFTLSQSGMVVHWWRTRPAHWRRRATLNGLGAVVTGASTVIFLATKFTSGGWVVVVAVPAFILLFRRINRYYESVARLLGFGSVPPVPHAATTLVIVPITTVSRLASQALSEALSIGDEVTAVTVVLGEDPDKQEEALCRQWDAWHPGVPLRVLHTDYASVIDPMIAFIDEERARHDRQIVVLIPVVVPTRLRYRLLHNHVDRGLSAALRHRTDVVVARVPIALDPEESRRAPRRTRTGGPAAKDT